MVHFPLCLNTCRSLTGKKIVFGAQKGRWVEGYKTLLVGLCVAQAKLPDTVVVVVVFTLKTVLASIQYLLFLTLQGKETNFRGHKLTQNKVQENKIK